MGGRVLGAWQARDSPKPRGTRDFRLHLSLILGVHAILPSIFD